MHKLKLTFLFIIICSVALGQSSNPEDNPSYTKTIPPPPTAASLGKFGDVPVSYYTGIPNISIPLYEAQSGDISLPVSMSYHAGGVKVEEIASWVGLGWSLDAGGVITRTVRGVADEKDVMGLTYKQNIDAYNAANEEGKQDILKDITDGKRDTEPDLFYFNFGGNSGKFFIGEDGVTVYTIPQQKLKITFTKDGLSNIIRWTIVDPNGFTYTFGKSAANSALNGVEYNETYSACGDASTLSTPLKIAASWYLVEIKSPRGFTMTFEYAANNFNFRNLGNQTEYYCNVDDMNGNQEQCASRSVFCFTRNTIEGKKLSRINFLNGKVEFQTKDRYDVCGEKALEYIRVFQGTSVTPIKTFAFNYTYFLGIGKTQQPTSCTTDQVGQLEGAFYRLKLNSVKETGLNNEEKNPYTFTYNESNAMPPRYRDLSTSSADSYAQDHWGYFNGKFNNRKGTNGPPTLVPLAFLENGGANIIEYPGADRSANETFAQAYTLIKIKYPTGGETSFQYESNRVPRESTAQFPVLLTPVTQQIPATLASNNTEIGKVFTSSAFTVFSEIEFAQGKGAKVKVSLFDGGIDYNESTTANGDCVTADLVVTREIIKADDGSVVYTNPAHDAEIFLLNGTYKIRLTRTGSNCNTSNFAISLLYTQYQQEAPTDPHNFLVGGVRIKKITDYDGINHSKDKVRTFHYGQFNNPVKSSGALVSFPVYDLGAYYTEWHEKTTITSVVYYSCSFLVHNSYTQYPLATTQGAFLGYKNVEVKFGANGENGASRFTFTTAEDYPDATDNSFPIAPPASFEWRRGALLEEVNYANSISQLLPVQKSVNEYDIFSPAGQNLFYMAAGLKVGIAEVAHTGIPLLYGAKFYNTATDWPSLARTETVNYSPYVLETELTTTKEYEYNPNNLQVAKTTTYGSGGEQIIEYFKYPLDYTGIPSSPTGQLRGIKKLQNQHIISPVIEKYTTRFDGSSEQLIGGQVSTYIESPVNTSLVVPEAIYALELPATPLALSGGTAPFIPSRVYQSAFDIDDRYLKKAELLHDNQGKLLQWKRTDDIPTAYVWAYNNSLPIAEAINAAPTQLFHTSFEEDGNSTDARTGRLSKTGGYTATVSLDNGTYLLTYFKKISAVWQLQSSTITVSGGSYSLSLTGHVDEIRIHPPNAQMTTYTYDPLYGRTSATDQNNITTHLKYDDLGRLHSITDDKGNVLQKYEYHYTTTN